MTKEIRIRICDAWLRYPSMLPQIEAEIRKIGNRWKNTDYITIKIETEPENTGVKKKKKIKIKKP